MEDCTGDTSESKVLTNEDLDAVSSCIEESECDSLAFQLNVTKFEIETCNDTKCLQKNIFQVWTSKAGQNATIEKLLKALGQVERVHIKWNVLHKCFGDVVLKYLPTKQFKDDDREIELLTHIEGEPSTSGSAKNFSNFGKPPQQQPTFPSDSCTATVTVLPNDEEYDAQKEIQIIHRHLLIKLSDLLPFGSNECLKFMEMAKAFKVSNAEIAECKECKSLLIIFGALESVGELSAGYYQSLQRIAKESDNEGLLFHIRNAQNNINKLKDGNYRGTRHEVLVALVKEAVTEALMSKHAHKVDICPQLHVYSEDKEAETLAEKIVFEVMVKMNSPSSRGVQTLNKIIETVSKIVSDLEMDGIKMGAVSRKCIVIAMQYETYDAVLSLLDYMDSDLLMEHLEELSTALGQHLGMNIQTTFSISNNNLSHIWQELENSLRETKMHHEEVCVPLECSTAEGFKHLFDYFEIDGTTNNLNQLSEDLSVHIGKNIEVTASLDLNQVRNALSNAEYEFDQTFLSQPSNNSTPNRKSLKTKSRSRKDEQKKAEAEDGIIEKVDMKTPLSPLTMPALPDNSSQNMIKRHGVLLSLTNSELQYMASLESVKKDYKEFILSETKNSDVKVILKKMEDMIEIHKMFHIALAGKLKNWNTDESIGIIFHVFGQAQFVDVYSAYVNSYEAANEILCELETKQRFRAFLKTQQKKSQDMMQLQVLLLKPIQRFPQFEMIIKDLLKYTPTDHHDWEPLQEAITCIKNVANQLNECKRNSKQRFLGQQIMRKMNCKHKIKYGKSNKDIFLIRQDNMEFYEENTSASNIGKERRLFLMNSFLILASMHYSKDNRLQGCKCKWHKHLSDLELTASPESSSRRCTNIDLAEIIHDDNILDQINQLVSALKRSYQGLSVNLIPSIHTQLLTEVQSKGYHHVLNSRTITIEDKLKKKRYVLNAADAITKQEWCIDFLMAKLALDQLNNPSWQPCQTEGVVQSQPSLFMTHLRVDVQRTNSKIKCAIKVFDSLNNEDSVEQLWLCSSNESQGQISIVSLDMDKPSLRESFKVTNCEIICMEMVPSYTTFSHKGDFETDSVWISTIDSEIHIFMLNGGKSGSSRQAVQVIRPNCVIVTMKHTADHVFCGSRCGNVVVYQRDADGFWSELTKIKLGSNAVTSLVCMGNSMWAAYGSDIHIIDIDICKSTGKVHHQLTMIDGQCRHFQHLVKSGVGIWASFAKQPNICLYHSETKRLIQDVNICSAINDFISTCSGSKESTKDYEVTCLMASVGFLWVGTNLGITLKYPLPRVKEGIPRINQHPRVALHAHRGPVKFLIQLHCGTSFRRQKSSSTSTHFVDKIVDKTKAIDIVDHMTLNVKTMQQRTGVVNEALISNGEAGVDVTSNSNDVIPKVTIAEDGKVSCCQDQHLAQNKNGEMTDSDLENFKLEFSLKWKDEKRQQRSLQDSDDSGDTEDQVDFLYPELKCAQHHGSTLYANEDINFNLSPERLYNGNLCEPVMNIPVGKSDAPSSLQLYSQEKKKLSSPSSPPPLTITQYAAEQKAVHSPSFDETTDKQNGSPCSETNVSEDLSPATLRKHESNTIIVVTGGDGYVYWKTREDLVDSRPDEPRLIFWMYKL